MFDHSARVQQLEAMHTHNSFVEQKKRLQSQFTCPSSGPFSGTSQMLIRPLTADMLTDYPVNEEGEHVLPHPLSIASDSARDVVRNRTDEKRWRRRMRLKKKVKISKKKKRGDGVIERPRDECLELDVNLNKEVPERKPNWLMKRMDVMTDFVFDDPPETDAVVRAQSIVDSMSDYGQKYEQLKNTRFKYFLTRRAIEDQPELLADEISLVKLDLEDSTEENKKSKKSAQSPGAFSIHVREHMELKKLQRKKDNLVDAAKIDHETLKVNASALSSHNIFSFDKAEIRRLMAVGRHDDILSQKLLYDVRYDKKWKPRYTKLILWKDAGHRRKPRKVKEPKNKAGWVVPMQNLCEKIGLDSTFFTRHPKVNLAETRAYILYQRLTQLQGPSEWLMNDESNVRNPVVEEFFEKEFDGRNVQRRMAAFNKCVEDDRDRVRIHGQYYNNIYLGKRMFGPGRKQICIRTMVGGMERRFEILDNQVNHIVFTHEASDRYTEKCRNPRIKCRDSTRVVLRYPDNVKNNFIHASYVQGGSLFNKFILTQAPMESTIGDFWRMVWQEETPYIFMLISRKDPSRCAQYWPKKQGNTMSFYGLEIINEGIDEFRSPLFRVTFLRIVGPGKKELRIEHWQGDMNNSNDLAIPLQLLRLARNCSKPSVVHCHLGVSRSAVLVAIEICITSLLRGPFYKHVVQKAVHLLRSQRPFSIETPMQFIYIHRVLHYFMQPLVGDPIGFQLDYKRWIDERAQRPFYDDVYQPIAGYRLLSPPIDPDLIVLARHRERPDYRREAHDCVGQLPIPLEDDNPKHSEELKLPKKYPRGSRYL